MQKYLDCSEAEHDLLMTINVGVQHTQDVLKLVWNYHRLGTNEHIPLAIEPLQSLIQIQYARCKTITNSTTTTWTHHLSKL